MPPTRAKISDPNILESFDPDILKKLGKGTTVKKNIDSVGECMKTGIIPIPKIIIGFLGKC
ncbi:MAG: hypothetical protein K9J74_00165 [Sulfuritalea sp.]|nr:hypothetical protein [Sulfuritalea sp.]